MHAKSQTRGSLLVEIAFLATWMSAQAFAYDKSSEQFHMEITPAKRIQARISERYQCPNLRAKTWGVVAGYPPEFDGQKDVVATMTVPKVPDARVTQTTEGGPLRQDILKAEWPVERPDQVHHMLVVRVYEATLMRRQLVRGAARQPPDDLRKQEREFYLSSDGDINHADAGFREWAGGHGLSRSPTENEITFAYRVLLKLAETHVYRWVPGSTETASIVCRQGWSHCSGLCVLYVSVLRANGIPARCIVGRMAKSSAKPNDDSTLHVKAEFFAQGVGWVPVDVSFAIDLPNIVDFFGKDDGDFLVMNFDRVLLDRPLALQKVQGHFGQWDGTFEGYESFDTIEVRVLRELSPRRTRETHP